MDQENKDLNLNFMPLGKGFRPYLATLVGLLIITLIVFIGALTNNKIKESRYIGQQIEFKNSIMVEGEGKIQAKPDLAIIELAVLSQAKDVVGAQQDNTKKTNDIIKALKDQGIEEKDLKTSNYSIYPRYQYLAGKSEIIGYEINQTIQVKIRKLDQIGQIIAKSATLGANQVGSLQFTFDNEEDLRNQARAKAIETAKTKASKLAEQLGVKLVKIIGFNESGNIMPQPYYAMKGAEMGGGGEAPQIQAGQNEVVSSVSITYEIQ